MHLTPRRSPRLSPRFSPRRACTIGVSALVSAALLGLGAARPSDRPTVRIDVAEPVPPVVQWVGPNSDITTPGFRLLTDAKSWTALWESHRGDLADHAHQGWIMPPEIDFARYMVIACFGGTSTNHNGERAQTAFRRGEALVVRYDSVTFQTASFGPEGDQGETSTPYGLWVVERFDGPVVVEEDRNSLIGGDPIWKEVHRFEANTRR